MNRKSFTKFSNFILGNGFYIALALCVGLILFSGYYLMSAVTPTITAPVSGTPELVIPSIDELPSLELPKLPTPEVDPPVQEEETSSNADVPAPETAEPELLEEQPEEIQDPQVETHVPELAVVVSYVIPTVGELLQSHSLEVLAYSETMGDWRTHNGITISAPVGSEVLATATGQVLSVEEDMFLGTTVTLMHENGFLSCYANLDEKVYVAQGDWVLGGQILACVGTSALSSGGEPYLHFMMSQSGQDLDPLEFLPPFE